MEREEENGVSELQGQLEIGLHGEIGETTKPVEGYDAEGNLINPALEDDMNRDPAGDVLQEIQAERLAVEINAIKAQTRGVLISAALEIGKRLIEAKALVPFGRWGAWLSENVDYSERRAQDLMRLFEEYGKKTIPQAIAELDYSKAVALLALPAEQRGALAEQAAAEGMSTRELQDEIDRLRKEAADRQVKLEDLLKENDVLSEEAEGAKEKLREEWETAKSTIQQEREATDRARAEAKAAGETAEALKKERDEAKKTSKLETDRAREAVKRANDTQRKLSEAEARIAELEAAEPQVREVEKVPEAVAAELEKLRAQSRQSDGVARLKLGYERLLDEFRAVEALVAAVRKEDAETGAKYAAAIAKGARMMAERIEGGGEA
jgi:chromosome segregation ATPase